MKKFWFLVTAALAACGLLLAGCHTVEGFGQDVQSGGHAISKAATKDTKK